MNFSKEFRTAHKADFSERYIYMEFKYNKYMFEIDADLMNQVNKSIVIDEIDVDFSEQSVSYNGCTWGCSGSCDSGCEATCYGGCYGTMN